MKKIITKRRSLKVLVNQVKASVYKAEASTAECIGTTQGGERLYQCRQTRLMYTMEQGYILYHGNLHLDNGEVEEYTPTTPVGPPPPLSEDEL